MNTIFESGIAINEEAIFDKEKKNPVYLVLMHSGTALASAIKKVTGDDWSHACIAFNAKLDPLYSFGTKGKGETGIGFSITHPTDDFFRTNVSNFVVYVMYVTNNAMRAMKERLQFFKDNADKLKYDLLGLFDIWFHRDSEDHEYKYFCSRFVMELIGKAQDLTKLPSLWKPQDITQLDNISLVNQGPDFFKYDKHITIRNEKIIKNGIKESTFEELIDESVIEEKTNYTPLYFYHMCNKDADLSDGLISLEYMYKNGMTDLFIKNSDKYRDRLCNGWNIYPDKDPDDLTAKEIYEGIKKFRGKDGNKYIYFFKYPPYKELNKAFVDIYKEKDIYRIDINDPSLKKIILDIDYGYIDSNSDNDPLSVEYYESITPDDYFGHFNPDPNGPLFATLHHIGIATKTGNIPKKYLTKVRVPNTMNDINESMIEEGYLNQLRMGNRNLRRHDDLTKIFKRHQAHPGLIKDIEKIKKIEDIEYLIKDYHTFIPQAKKIRQNYINVIKLGECYETRNYYKGIHKLYIDRGVTLEDIELTMKWYNEVYYPMLLKRKKEIKAAMKESTLMEDSTTFGTIVGPRSNPDTVYVVNYLKKNTFTDNEEDKYHFAFTDSPFLTKVIIHDGLTPKMITYEDFDKIAESSETYLFNGYASNFFDILEHANSDIDFYTGLSNLPFRSHNQIKEDAMFTKVTSLHDEIKDIRECMMASFRNLNTLSVPYIQDMDTISETSISAYTDPNGVFLLNESTGLRTPSVKNGRDITKEMMRFISGNL